jgi:hypothetical protein
MQQHDGLSAATHQEMHLVTINRYILRTNSVQTKPGVGLTVDEPERIAPYQKGRTRQQKQESAEYDAADFLH